MTTDTSPNIGERWVEELELALQRFGRGAELLWDQSDAPVGRTPRELVGRKGKARLYLYRAQAEQVEAVPVQFVPYLGLGGPHVFDQPGASFVEFFSKQAFNLYILVWRDLGLEDPGASR